VRYYKDEAHVPVQPAGVIQFADVVAVTENLRDYRFAVQVKSGRTFEFQTQDAASAQAWFTYLSEYPR
jgi:hypothetical protein